MMKSSHILRNFGCRLAVLALLAVSFGAFTSASAQTLLLDYRFNEGAGETANNGGTVGNANIWGNGGTVTWVPGVSGQQGDFAVRIGTGGSIRFNSGFSLPLSKDIYMNGQMQSFTLTGWINPTENQGNFGRILDLTAITDNGIILGTSTNNGLILSVNGSNVTANLGYAINQWTFFAVTYDGTSTANNVRVYAGTKDAAPDLVATLTLNKGTVLAPTNQDNRAIFLGNNSSNQRPYNGLLDNIQLYGAIDASGALSLDEGNLSIRSIYGAQIPEASTWGLLSAVAAAAAIVVRRHLRRR